MNSKSGSTLTVEETRAAPRVETTGASILSGASSTSVLGGEIINSQRDHNRATFIINIGGPDSDTSRPTLAVSKPSTLSTVGDSPHASTSSLVRDLPYSSTSPASNQVQSSLEELSASTDSGLGGSEVSSEIESPDSLLNEEENLVKEKPNAIYQRQMYHRGHGFPLWIPQPNNRLSRSYRRQGVSIGDVGIIAWDGSFDFLFNVCLRAGHPNNPNELPEGFHQLQLRPTDVSEVRAHSSHSHMTSTSVQKKEATFECFGSEGAVLTMPQGAYHEDLKNISRFRNYALKHAESWYEYANGPCGREIGNGELHMVTGCDKTTSWGIATYSHLQSKRPEGSMMLLSFEAVGNERHGRQPYAWDCKGEVEARVGPEDEELANLGVQDSAPPRNQCTFIRSIKPTLGQDDWERLQSKVAALVEEPASAQPLDIPFTSVLGVISPLPGRISSLRGYGRGGTSKLTDSVTPVQASAAHPATYVTDMILQKCPKAKVVVVHDSDWCSVIRDSDEDWTCTAQDLPRRIQEAFDIVQEDNGNVYLQEKLRSSQRLGISSLVSVKLENEDRLLLQDRNPDFHPSDISLSKPKVDDWDAYYHLGNELDRGAFVIIMKAMSRTTGEWFAVKMIDGKRYGYHLARSASFKREISIMEKFKHPNICELKEVFYLGDNDINLVLELIEGGDLVDYIVRQNRMPEVDVKHIAYQICDALAYIHSKGITHRELKPEKILLTKDRPPRVKVAFGLSKFYDRAIMPQLICGARSYLAPEAVKQENHQGYDNLVDSWSVGLIIFSMLTNEGPFIEDKNQHDIRARIAGRHIDWSILENVNPSPEALSFIHALVQEDPHCRMSLKDALEHPWLQSYTPVHTSDVISRHTSSSPTIRGGWRNQ